MREATRESERESKRTSDQDRENERARGTQIQSDEIEKEKGGERERGREENQTLSK